MGRPREGVGRRHIECLVELVEKKLQGALPVHLGGPGRSGAAGLAPSVVSWARASGFSGEAGRTLVLLGESGALAGALFGIGDGEGALALGALSKTLPEGDWHFASTPAEPELAAIALALGGYVLLADLEVGQGAARQAGRCRRGARSPHRRGRLPDTRPGQHADQRHGAGQSGEGGADFGRGSQGRNLRHQGRRSAYAEFPDDPCRRPCLIRRAAADRHDLGATGRAEGDAGRQGRLLRHRRSRHQAIVRHAVDEEGHGRRGQCAWRWPR